MLTIVKLIADRSWWRGYFSRDKLLFLQQHGRYRVICYGYKRDKHAKALAEKRAELQEMTRKKNVALVKMQELHTKHPELEIPALAQIESEIRSLQEQVRKLKSPFFATLEEANAVAESIAQGRKTEERCDDLQEGFPFWCCSCCLRSLVAHAEVLHTPLLAEP